MLLYQLVCQSSLYHPLADPTAQFLGMLPHPTPHPTPSYLWQPVIPYMQLYPLVCQSSLSPIHPCWPDCTVPGYAPSPHPTPLLLLAAHYTVHVVVSTPVCQSSLYHPLVDLTAQFLGMLPHPTPNPLLPLAAHHTVHVVVFTPVCQSSLFPTHTPWPDCIVSGYAPSPHPTHPKQNLPLTSGNPSHWTCCCILFSLSEFSFSCTSSLTWLHSSDVCTLSPPPTKLSLLPLAAHHTVHYVVSTPVCQSSLSPVHPHWPDCTIPGYAPGHLLTAGGRGDFQLYTSISVET